MLEQLYEDMPEREPLDDSEKLELKTLLEEYGPVEDSTLTGRDLYIVLKVWKESLPLIRTMI